MRLLGLIEGASNGTFLAEVADGHGSALAVYKPRRAEAPLWDFPDGTLYRREVAAFELADALGWPHVPPTAVVDGSLGVGSAQLFVEHDPEEHFFALAGTRLDDFAEVALFDAIANNADRKAGHCLHGPDGNVWLVDHGVCFAEEPKLRTVIWDFAGDPLPEALRERVAAAAASLDGGEAADRLSALLAPGEVRAAADRAARLAATGCFPLPGSSRSVPWPPV